MSFSRRAVPAILAIAAFILSACVPAALAQKSSTAVLAEFTGKLDTRSAKVGDTITARTRAKAKLADGAELPKGAKLIGTVVAVESKQAGNGTSSLSIRFDRVEVKGSAQITVHAALVAIAPPPLASGELPLGSVHTSGGSLSTQSGYGVSDAGGTDIPLGSTLEGVGLGDHVGTDGTSQLRGNHRDIKLEPGGLLKVAFF
jgi:hypothetical protein